MRVPARGAFLHFAGIRAEKARRHRRRGIAGCGEIQREMMPLDPPAPRLRARRAENR